MTDLTDKWKKGELETNKYYYVRDISYILPAKLGRYDNQLYFSGNEVGYGYEENRELEVLAPVPSYEEWQAKLEENAQLKKWCEEFNALEAAKENAQLKELLKECKRQFEEVELCRYDVADTDQEDWFKISTEQAGIANKMIAKIDEVLGEKK